MPDDPAPPELIVGDAVTLRPIGLPAIPGAEVTGFTTEAETIWGLPGETARTLVLVEGVARPVPLEFFSHEDGEWFADLQHELSKQGNLPQRATSAEGRLDEGEERLTEGEGRHDVSEDRLDALETATGSSDASMIGAIAFFPATAAPLRWLELAGALVLRADYPLLWAFAQASGNLAASDGAWTAGQFSPGNGTTNFRVPDYRGEFVRAWDHARGVDTGRAIGAAQGALTTLPAHTHPIAVPDHTHTIDPADHTHSLPLNATAAEAAGYGLSAAPAFQDRVLVTGGGVSTGANGGAAFTGGAGGAFSGTSGAASTTAGAETRPRNVAAMACIRAK